MGKSGERYSICRNPFDAIKVYEKLLVVDNYKSHNVWIPINWLAAKEK